jgi:hypothetical protein
MLAVKLEYSNMATKPQHVPKELGPLSPPLIPGAPCPSQVTLSALQCSGSPREMKLVILHSLDQPNKLPSLRDSSQGGHQAFLNKGRAPAAIWHDLHKSKQSSLVRHTPPPLLPLGHPAPLGPTRRRFLLFSQQPMRW